MPIHYKSLKKKCQYFKGIKYRKFCKNMYFKKRFTTISCGEPFFMLRNDQ